jgi:nucleotide-binding universal stress UspA family protein
MNILIPTDFSSQVDFALILANKIAAKIPANIELLNVIQCRTEARVGADGQIEVEEDSVQGYLQAQYHAAQKGFEMYDLSAFEQANTMVEFGPLSGTIVARAEQGKFDLIIMGTKGAYGLREFFSGSETQHVVRHSKAPVLSLMCDRSDLEIEDILLVHDILDEKATLPPAIKKLIEAFGAKLHILNKQGAKNDVLTDTVFQAFLEREHLQKVNAHFYKDKIDERAIIGFDQMHKIDLIMISAHMRSGLSQLFQPELAEKLVNHMHKPIITFHI